VEQLVRAADARGISALVRVARPDAVTTALDAGAAGVVLPHFGADDRSRELAAAARFHPAGTRGACTGSRAVAYGLDDFGAYAARANEDVLVVGQIEDAASVEALDDVLAVPGLDAVLPGRSDLAAEYRVAGQLDHPVVTAALDRVADAAVRRGVVLGMYVTGGAAGREWRERGARLIVCSIDYKVLSGAYAALLAELRGAV
jgi:4-hydroxy-2-oxoheptanedioate aldolase